MQLLLIVVAGREVVAEHLLVEYGRQGAALWGHDPDPIGGAAAAELVLGL